MAPKKGGKASGKKAQREGDSSAPPTVPTTPWPDMTQEKPTPWAMDQPLTDRFISHINENEDLRNALYSDGKLQRLEDGDTSKDHHFFNIAHKIFGDRSDHKELADAVAAAKKNNEKKDVIDLMKARWHQLVDMTNKADKDLGEHARGIHDETEFSDIDDASIRRKLENTKTKHPWYFKIRKLLPHHSDKSKELGKSKEAPTSRDLLDYSGSNEPSVVVLPALADESSPNGGAVPTHGITIGVTAPTTSTMTFGDGDPAWDRSVGRNHGKKPLGSHPGDFDYLAEEGGHTATRDKSLPATPVNASFRGANTSQPVSMQINQPVAVRREQPLGLDASNDNVSRGRSSRAASPAFNRPTSPAFNRSTSPAFDRPLSAARERSRSRARSDRSQQRIVDAPTGPVITAVMPVAEATVRHEAPRSRAPSPMHDQPRSVKEWADEVASVRQIDPMTTEIETLGPAHGEQLPVYSVQGSEHAAVSPSRSGRQGLGYTGSPMPDNKTGDDKHPFTTTWTADAQKTPHFGFGYDLPPQAGATTMPAPVKVEQAPSQMSRLERPSGSKLSQRSRSPSPIRVPMPEPVIPVIHVEIPTPIEVIIPPTKGKETARSIGNVSPSSRHSKAPSQSGAFSVMAGLASATAAATAAAPVVVEPIAARTNEPIAPRPRNLSNESQATVVEPVTPPVIYTEKDTFRTTPWSSVQPPVRSQSIPVPPPMPVPGRSPNPAVYVPPALRRGVAPVSNPTVPSRLRSVDPPLSSSPGNSMFPTPDTQTRPSVPLDVPYYTGKPILSPMNVTGASMPQPTIPNFQSQPRASSNKPPTTQPLASGGGRIRTQSESQSMVPVVAGAAALGTAAYAANKMDESGDADRARRRANSELLFQQQQQQLGTNPTLAALAQQRGNYQPWVPVTDSTGYVQQVRPPGTTPVTFDFGNQLDADGVRGGTGGRRLSGSKNPTLTVSVSPALHPIGVIPAHTDSIVSSETVRPSRPGDRSYDQDKRDRERERQRQEERYGLVRRRRWDDERSLTTVRTRYASPARSEEYCDCSTCRNAWIWKGIEYCGVAVALGFYLAFMTKVLFQNQGIRLY
ncbi:hypothetical protein FRB95_005565 [Tulasnella sp. JGI-2019a]|nr:hypothetical protein FRB95_005565 [Tulasnella sp. JGI-2019a]